MLDFRARPPSPHHNSAQVHRKEVRGSEQWSNFPEATQHGTGDLGSEPGKLGSAADPLCGTVLPSEADGLAEVHLNWT